MEIAENLVEEAESDVAEDTEKKEDDSDEEEE